MPNISEGGDRFFMSHKDMAEMTGYLHASRRVLIAGELNEKSLRKAALELVKLDLASSEPITILLESGGGNVVPTQQFEDAINMINSPVDALVLNDCCSMAVDMVQMCRRRMMLPSARMLVHYVRNKQPWIVDDPEQLDRDLAYFRENMIEMRERRLSLYQRRTGLSREKLSELFRYGEVHAAYFSAKQAIELGFADEIVTDFKLLPRKEKLNDRNSA